MSLPKPYYQDSAVTIYCADCREILPLLPKVDLVLRKSLIDSTRSAILGHEQTRTSQEGNGAEIVGAEESRDRMALLRTALVNGTDRGLFPGFADRDLQSHAEDGYSVSREKQEREREWSLQGWNGEHLIPIDDPKGQVLSVREDEEVGDPSPKRKSYRQSPRESSSTLRELSQSAPPKAVVETSKILLLTDPPYGTGGRRRLAPGQGSNPKSAVTTESWDTPDLSWVHVLPNCPWMIFWPSGRALQLLSIASECNHAKHRQLFWKKTDPMPQPGGLASFSVEPIWLLSENGLAIRGLDWFEASTPRTNRDADATGHPYQKPIEVMRWLVSLTDAQTILDPFMGSGTTLRAAKDLGRKAIGIEIEERYCEIAAKRMAQEVFAL